MRHVLVASLALVVLACVNAADLPPAAASNGGDRELVRRQAYGPPLYSPCGPALGCAPAYAPPPPPPPPAPLPPPACAPGGCMAPAACMGGACACPGPALYSPVVGCAPPPPPPLPPMPLPLPPIPAAVPAPAPAGRLIPQALPGASCEPGVECTGGSVCSMGICLCPPELVQEGTVCVSRTIYGVVPGAPPPPPPPAPLAYPAMPAPIPVRPAFFDPCIGKRSVDSKVEC